MFNDFEVISFKKIEKSANIHFIEITEFPRYKQKLSEIGLFKRKDLRCTHNIKAIFSEI